MSSSNVVTRFAPSPTGLLHIGGARTALFNWLFARSNGGKFHLRIEDTDLERSTVESEKAIVDSLAWLGIQWDEEIARQSAHRNRHEAIVNRLIQDGLAYRCFSTDQEIATARELARIEGKSLLFESPWRDVKASNDMLTKRHTVRLKTPLDGATIVADKVFGSIKWQNNTIEDLVIARSDGSPTYNLAVVVDDHDMGITHVIRGDEHLANTAKQIVIYRALQWKLPRFAHVPLIYNEQGKKLSKRDGAAGLEYYRDQGIIPPAVRNYLARLGWSHGDNEYFTTQQAIRWFSLKAIRKSPARLNSDKLLDLSRRHIAESKDEELLGYLLTHARCKCEQVLDERFQTLFLQGAFLFKRRARTIVELFEQVRFLMVDVPLQLDDAAIGALKSCPLSAYEGLVRVVRSSDWSKSELERALKEFGNARGLGLGPILKPLRAALTGRLNSPGVFEIMILLGQELTFSRLETARCFVGTRE